MDLYIQIGLLLIFMAAFALVAYFYSVNISQGSTIFKTLDKPSVNYSSDSTITSPTFTVDNRVFTQWAINARDQRQVYLLYPNNLEPDKELYGQFLYEIELTQQDQDPSNRKIDIRPQTPNQVSNALFISDPTNKSLDYLNLFTQEAKNRARDGMITVHTYTDELSGEVIYICQIRG